MSPIQARVRKLEQATKPIAGRFFRLSGGTGAEDEAVTFLKKEGFSPSASDIVICRTIYRPGGKVAENAPLTLRWVQPSTTCHDDASDQL